MVQCRIHYYIKNKSAVKLNTADLFLWLSTMLLNYFQSTLFKLAMKNDKNIIAFLLNFFVNKLLKSVDNILYR